MIKANLAARAIAITFALTIWPAALRAQTAPATVRPTPATLEIGVGQTVAVAIQLENVQGAYGIDVRGRFNPAVVEIVGASVAAPLSAGGFIKPDFVVVNTIDNQAGTFHWAATQINPAEPVNGSGPVVVFSLRGKASGQSSLIELTAVELANANGLALPVTFQTSSVAVVAPGAGTPLPTLAGPVASATAPVPVSTPTVPPLRVNTPMPPVFSTTAIEATPQALPTVSAPPATTAPPATATPSRATAAPPATALNPSTVASPAVARASNIPPTPVSSPTQALPAPTRSASDVKSPSPTPPPVAGVTTAIAAVVPANVNANVPPAAFAPGSLAPAAPLGGVKPPAAVVLPLSPEPSPPPTSPYEQVGISAGLIALGLLGWRLFSGAARSA